MREGLLHSVRRLRPHLRGVGASGEREKVRRAKLLSSQLRNNGDRDGDGARHEQDSCINAWVAHTHAQVLVRSRTRSSTLSAASALAGSAYTSSSSGGIGVGGRGGGRDAAEAQTQLAPSFRCWELASTPAQAQAWAQQAQQLVAQPDLFCASTESSLRFARACFSAHALQR